MSEGLFGIHAAALELRSQRMGLITSNIANAAALKAKSSGMDTDQAAAAATLYRLPLMPSLDGNTVGLPTEPGRLRREHGGLCVNPLLHK